MHCWYRRNETDWIKGEITNGQRVRSIHFYAQDDDCLNEITAEDCEFFFSPTGLTVTGYVQTGDSRDDLYALTSIDVQFTVTKPNKT